MSKPNLILASTSVYRANALQRLGLAFEQRPPNVDESPHKDETPRILAQRLAQAKAHAILTTTNNHTWVIGSDQVGWSNGRQIKETRYGRSSGSSTHCPLRASRPVLYRCCLIETNPSGG